MLLFNSSRQSGSIDESTTSEGLVDGASDGGWREDGCVVDLE